MARVITYNSPAPSSVFGGRVGGRGGTVIHTTGGSDSTHYLRGGSLADGRRVSCNALISRNGDIHILYPSNIETYHAGTGQWPYKGRLTHDGNTAFVGVEIEQRHSPLMLATLEQYISCAAYQRAMAELWGFPPDHAIGHYQWRGPGGDRWDPVGWAWGAFFERVFVPTFEVVELTKEVLKWERQLAGRGW